MTNSGEPQGYTANTIQYDERIIYPVHPGFSVHDLCAAET